MSEHETSRVEISDDEAARQKLEDALRAAKAAQPSQTLPTRIYEAIAVFGMALLRGVSQVTGTWATRKPVAAAVTVMLVVVLGFQLGSYGYRRWYPAATVEAVGQPHVIVQRLPVMPITAAPGRIYYEAGWFRNTPRAVDINGDVRKIPKGQVSKFRGVSVGDELQLPASFERWEKVETIDGLRDTQVFLIQG